MSHYIVRATKPGFIETPLWDDDKQSLKPDLSVDDAKSVDTGLVTPAGDPIFRVQPPIGFGRNEEW